MKVLVKIFFHLEKDDDDYPPVAAESLWAAPGRRPGEYIIDNIPFFARGATMGDTISTHDEDGLPWFDMVLQRSQNSLIRAVLFDATRVEEMTRCLIDLGCSVEYMSSYRLLAISIPGQAELTKIQEYLEAEQAAGRLDYEEPILRQ